MFFNKWRPVSQFTNSVTVHFHWGWLQLNISNLTVFQLNFEIFMTISSFIKISSGDSLIIKLIHTFNTLAYNFTFSSKIYWHFITKHQNCTHLKWNCQSYMLKLSQPVFNKITDILGFPNHKISDSARHQDICLPISQRTCSS
jgi:hypothetical protein